MLQPLNQLTFPTRTQQLPNMEFIEQLSQTPCKHRLPINLGKHMTMRFPSQFNHLSSYNFNYENT